MRSPKFSVNAVVGIVLIFSAMILFFSVRLTQESDPAVLNRFEPIEGTALSVRTSTEKPNGLYEGNINTGVLRVPGDFGVDWGAAAVGDTLYINEYRRSDLGQIYCDVVAVDLNSYRKTTVEKGALLRGRNASGDLVITKTAPSGNQPGQNALSRLSALWTGKAPTEVTVIILNGQTCEGLLRVRDDSAMEDAVLNERYLAKTAGEAAS